MLVLIAALVRVLGARTRARAVGSQRSLGGMQQAGRREGRRIFVGLDLDVANRAAPSLRVSRRARALVNVREGQGCH
jgi:hypothetical protein